METPVRAGTAPRATTDAEATTDTAAEAAALDPELPFNVFARACPSRETLEHVTGRWGGLTMGALYEGPRRFNELRRRVDGVSEKMLSQTLHALERDGLVHREAQSTNPPRVDYELTPLGRQVAERLLALIHFLEDGMPEVLAARTAYDETRGAR
ncbi:winged helix-turn-helix transcriptional regulator [Streptomyces antimicrobicus]|uniref:Helix-turn-helix transcriptional regulator n=1 Tax=Streptomyces antimicrobicus TaxID=2883108 RepID=A0ABS8BDL7_9ACTN|nr:helix-turn-helix domain-containing protein [Streptomyces antimicrobicus]MCB5182628.1 helix-turn-helix transcriptional regulator [Streptomyces antimicrobicus]